MTLHVDEDAGDTVKALQSDPEVSARYDKDGFFADPQDWTLALAVQIALDEGMGELDAAQRAMLLSLRAEFSKHQSVSALSHLCHAQGHEPDCLHQMFRTPRQAWRLAGLPNPGEEAKAYLA